MDAIKMQLSRDRVELIKEALDTQVRLLDSYINKNDRLERRLMKFQHVRQEIEEILLAD